MFDATRLLGGLIDTGLGRGASAQQQPAPDQGGGIGWGTVAAAGGVAAVGGLAYAAYRHHKAGGFGQGGPGLFGNEAPPAGAPAAPGAPGGPGGLAGAFGGGQASGPGGFGGGPGGFGGGPGGPGAPEGYSPPAFTSAEGAGFGAAPGHAPAPVAAAAPAAARPEAAASTAQEQSLLLVRAMIAAAHVDGRIDATEQQRILASAERAGFGPGEREALARELAAPHPPNLLLGQVRDPELAAQLYLVTLLAIDRDNEAEQTYVRALPLVLQIPPERVAHIHAQLGLAPG